MTFDQRSYERELWQRAVADAEQDVMLNSPSLTGGREPRERIERYVARGRELQDRALARMRHAQKKLDRLGGPECR